MNAMSGSFDEGSTNDDLEDRLDTSKIRQKRLQHIFDTFVWLLRGFGTIPRYGLATTASVKRRDSSFFKAVFLLVATTSALIFFSAELSYMYINAIAGLKHATIIQIHFISRSQFAVVTAVGMLTIAMRSGRLPAVITAIVQADSWSDESDWRLVKNFMRYKGLQLVYLTGLFVAAVTVKIKAVMGMQVLYT